MIPGDSLLKFAFAFGFSGVYMGVWETLESATAATMLPAARRGIGFGLLATVNGIGDLLSSMIIGIVWIYTALGAMLFVMASSLLGAAIIWNSPNSARSASSRLAGN
jgi:hypothetical protein